MADNTQQHFWLNENIQAIAAIIILIIGFGFLEWGSATETIKQGVKDLMFIVATFYFGGSRSSSNKDATISKALDQAQQTPTDNSSSPNVVKADNVTITNP